MARFDGKRILITGGSSGIGLATAKRIVEEGGEVGITGRSQDHLDAAARELPDASLVLQNDASDPDEAKKLGKKVADSMGRIDGLFLNAGYGDFWQLTDTDEDTWNQMMHTNVRGPALHMAHLAETLTDGAAVLLTSSVAGHIGQPQGAVYASSKAAMAAMARSYAADLAGRGIRVNSVAPGPIDTEFFAGIDLPEEQKESMVEQIRDSVALGRFGTAKEVAAVACFLLSDDASFVTGSEYFVDGGMTFR